MALYSRGFDFDEANFAPRRWVDLRTINSGRSTTVSGLRGAFEFRMVIASRAASSPILRLCWSMLERGTRRESS